MQSVTERNTLRFLTCGSVDDGKSTLIGRLLYDSGNILPDQLAVLASESSRFGTTLGYLDFSLVLDGLIAEREQNITIDVAYRYFSTSRRRFVVADSPGHEQFTRNMVTAASQSELGVVVVDARRGVCSQTRRHLHLLSLLDVRHVILAVSKMDLVFFDEARFRVIEGSFDELARKLRFMSAEVLPVSGRFGDNVVETSARMPWFDGRTLIGCLEDTNVGEPPLTPVRFPIQLVIRAGDDFRGYAGSVAHGALRCGDELIVARTGRPATVARIVTLDGDVAAASSGEAVTLTLDRELDVSRGDVLSKPDSRPSWSTGFGADLVWLDENPLVVGRSYWLKTGAQSVQAIVARIESVIDTSTGTSRICSDLGFNDIGRCWLNLSSGVAHDRYAEVPATGCFILIDQVTNSTAAAGMIRDLSSTALRNVSWHEFQVSKKERLRLANQRPGVVWFTGLPASGKSTIADAVERRLVSMCYRTYVLDGDNLRHGLNRDLGFSPRDRAENIRRVAEVSRILTDAGILVLVALISPMARERQLARELIGTEEFMEVFVDAPLAIAEARDPKGLYRKARQGLIADFTGITAPYELPTNPDLRLDAAGSTVESLASQVIALLTTRGHLLPL